ncbi:MAG: hypothetical protein U9P10_12990 [Thermodesulfobacteriota bacterium]|nr:hypothetical protein [Thermodesulfobacteriota bacterium]
MVSLGSAAKIIQRPNTGKSDNSGPGLEEAGQVENRDGLFSDAFLSLEDLVSPKSDAVKQSGKKIKDDIAELSRNNRWEDIISLYHPVEEKIPDLVKAGEEGFIRQKIAFAMGQVNPGLMMPSRSF